MQENKQLSPFKNIVNSVRGVKVFTWEASNGQGKIRVVASVPKKKEGVREEYDKYVYFSASLCCPDDCKVGWSKKRANEIAVKRLQRYLERNCDRGSKHKTRWSGTVSDFDGNMKNLERSIKKEMFAKIFNTTGSKLNLEIVWTHPILKT